MIRQEIELRDYDWKVHCYFAFDCHLTDEIIDKLVQLGCSGDFLLRAATNMATCKPNHGLTFSNTRTGESIVVVGLTSSPSEFLNSLTHELFHLVTHICGARRVDINSEDAAYLMGNVSGMIYKYVKNLLQ